MNDDEREDVGADDIVSTKLELITADDPIAGPIAVEVGMRLREEPNEPPWKAERKACVEAGAVIAVG
jgi:hypothetical protein